jgi:pimeloyl-ACP methyl ester carboxylesterase
MNRGEATWGPSGNPNDVAPVITKIANDKYLTAPDHPAARKKIHDLLTAAPQDVTHSDMARDVPSSLPCLHEIHAPTLILVGDADIPDVHAHSGALEIGIPNARRIVLPDTGHLLYLEKPDEFSRIVIDFLDAHRETPEI